MERVLNWLVDHLVLTVLGTTAIIAIINVMRRESKHVKAKSILDKAIASNMNEPLSLHPEIDPSLCGGCAACTKVCPEGDVLQMINHRAVLVKPTKCIGHGECERACPFSAITLVFGTKTRGMDIPRLTMNYETNVSGLYIAGELGGMGLIRNAVKQGALAAQHAVKNLPSGQAQYDLFIVGAGPAGLAASLVAISERKTYLTIEQGGFGGTVYNFPRQKVVMSHPMDLPIIGKMKFAENKVSKERLLSYWNKVRKQTGLKIKEQTKFETLTKSGNVFKVKTNQGEFTAKKVILAMGVRGSPRKLGVDGEDKPKVTYNLLDPEQYQGKKIAVVGGGNSALEAALMLADSKWNNKVHLLVRSGAFDRANEENINAVNALEAKGRLKIFYNSSVMQIRDSDITIAKDQESQDLPNDYVFVFAGAEMPHKFLMSLGIKIEKKFGEGLKTTG